ncbi:MAG TPA: cellulose synthase operon protein YhjQ/BcsQ [Longimicrobiales bacterium]|nr:cellulose synthase operon protein YhjQ/BcsQ [Longimicrobiales bacterium]
MTRGVESLRAFAGQGGHDGGHRRRPHVTVVGAGKGGVGTSSLAALVGLQMARAGAAVLLVDADETVGTLHMLFGLPAEVPGLGTLRGGGVDPERLLVSVEPGLALFPGGGGGPEASLALAASERRLLLRRVAALYDRFDAVVVDGGSRLDSVMAACAAASGRVLAVTTKDPIAQAGSYALAKVAGARFQGLPVELLVNRASEAEARKAHELVAAAAQTFAAMDVPFAGSVAEDPALAEAAGSGASLLGLPAGTPAAQALAAVAERLVAEAAGAPAAVLPLLPASPAR